MGWRGWRVEAGSQSDFMLFLRASHRSILSRCARPSGSEQTRRLLEVTLHIQSNDLKKRTRAVSRVSSLHQSQLRFKCVSKGSWDKQRQKDLTNMFVRYIEHACTTDGRIGANCICCYIYFATREMAGFKTLARLSNLIRAKLLF